MIVGVIDPAVRHAVEEFKPLPGVRPKPALKRVRDGVTVAYFTNVITFGVIKPIDRMFSVSSRPLSDNARGGFACTKIVKHHNVATLSFLVIDQRQNVDVAETGERRLIENVSDVVGSGDLTAFLRKA